MLRCNRDGPLCILFKEKLQLHTANQCRLRKRGRPMLWWKGDKEALNYDNLDETKLNYHCRKGVMLSRFVYIYYFLLFLC